MIKTVNTKIEYNTLYVIHYHMQLIIQTLQNSCYLSCHTVTVSTALSDANFIQFSQHSIKLESRMDRTEITVHYFIAFTTMGHQNMPCQEITRKHTHTILLHY